MHLWASCSESYRISMFLQRLASAASPLSSADDSFFFHTWGARATSTADTGRSGQTTWFVTGRARGGDGAF